MDAGRSQFEEQTCRAEMLAYCHHQHPEVQPLKGLDWRAGDAEYNGVVERAY